MLVSNSYESHYETVAQLVYKAFQGQLNITPNLLRLNARPCAGVDRVEQLAMVDGEIVGIVIVSAMRDMAQLDPALANAPPIGWIELLAVDPQHQRQGHGSTLLDWAIGWLTAHGCKKIWLGANIRTFMPGVPAALSDGTFFNKRGFVTLDRPCWDVACDLSIIHYPLPTANCQLSAATLADLPDLLAFFCREFPGRWRYEFEQFIIDGGRPSDYIVLRVDGVVHGFCQLTFADSTRPLERYHMQALPRPWGQLGAIGVSASLRGQQFGRSLLLAGLGRLQAAGVHGCVIDWTDLVDFYSKFSFKLFRQYLMMQMTLSA